jgi:hypothetical protein
MQAPSESRGSRSLSTVSGTYVSGERSTDAMLMDYIPGARAVCTSFNSMIGLFT